MFSTCVKCVLCLILCFSFCFWLFSHMCVWINLCCEDCVISWINTSRRCCLQSWESLLKSGALRVWNVSHLWAWIFISCQYCTYVNMVKSFGTTGRVYWPVIIRVLSDVWGWIHALHGMSLITYQIWITCVKMKLLETCYPLLLCLCRAFDCRMFKSVEEIPFFSFIVWIYSLAASVNTILNLQSTADGTEH